MVWRANSCCVCTDGTRVSSQLDDKTCCNVMSPLIQEERTYLPSVESVDSGGN